MQETTPAETVSATPDTRGPTAARARRARRENTPTPLASPGCTDCPANSHVEATGSDELEDCTCNAGFVFGDTDTVESCTACPAGKFEESDSCVTCGPGTYSLSASGGAAGCLRCGTNSLSVADRSKCECDLGYMCTAAQLIQQDCGTGLSLWSVMRLANLAMSTEVDTQPPAAVKFSKFKSPP